MEDDPHKRKARNLQGKGTSRMGADYSHAARVLMGNKLMVSAPLMDSHGKALPLSEKSTEVEEKEGGRESCCC